MASIRTALPGEAPFLPPGMLTARARRQLLVGLLLGGALSQAAQAADPVPVGAGADWTTFSGQTQGLSYSALTDITPANVATLKEEFSLPTGVYGSHNGGPLVVNDPASKTSTLYVVTPYPNYLEAYDLKTGKLKWTYKPQEDKFARGVNCCDTTNRGAAYYNGKIVYTLLDNHVVAVDAKTGKQLWKSVSLADPRTGVTMNGAPVIVPDKANPAGKQRVIVGSSNGEMGVRGWVKGLDLATGKLEWTAYTTGPDKDVGINVNNNLFKPFYAKDQGTDVGATSWPTGPNAGTDKYKPTYMNGGSSVWSWLTYDPDTDLVFYGTSQPGVWNPDMRCAPEQLALDPHACDNKWGASIFARKPTGEAVWAYQMVPHDSWDYDSTSENMVINRPIAVKGVTHDKLLVNFHKNGFAYVFDRATGEVLSAPPFTHVNWATHVDLNTGEPDIVEAFKVHQGQMSDVFCPSVLGGKPWLPGAYSPDTGMAYIPTLNLCQSIKALKTEFIAGSPYMGQSAHGALGPLTTPDGKFFMSELVAWDLTKQGPDGQYGVKAWGVQEKSAIWGGVLATAGGLVFYGTQDKAFKAVDMSTGKVVFSTAMECSTVGNPISFKGPDGKQRIAVFSGVGRLAGQIGGGGSCPSNNKLEDGWDVSHPTYASKGGRVHIYKLPS